MTAMLPPSPGPLLQKIIDRKLHILPADGEQLEDNIKLLSRNVILNRKTTSDIMLNVIATMVLSFNLGLKYKYSENF